MVDLSTCRMGGGLQAKRSCQGGSEAVMPGRQGFTKTVIPTGRKANGHAGAAGPCPKRSFRAVAIGEESLHAKTLCLRSVRFRAFRFPRFRSLTPPRAFPASPSLGLTSGRHAPAAPLCPAFPKAPVFAAKGKKDHLPAKAPKNASESLGRIHRGIFARCRNRETGRSARASFSCPCAARPCVPYHPCGRTPTYPPPMPLRLRVRARCPLCAPRVPSRAPKP